MPYIPVDYFSASRRGAMIPAGPSGDYRDRITPGFTTPDLQSIAANTRRSKLAHDLFTRSSLARANQDNALLESALRSGSVADLFNQPTTDDEARLQQIVQADYNAKERGAQLIPTWQTLLKKRQLEETLADDEQRRLLAQKQYEQSLREEEMKRQQLGLTREQFENLKQHQNSLLDFERQKFGVEQVFKQGEANRQKAAADRQDQRILAQDFATAQKAVQSGTLTAEDAIANLPNLNASQQSILRSYEAEARAQAQQAQKQADTYNKRLQDTSPKGIPAVEGGWFGFGARKAIPPTDADFAAARSGVELLFNRDPVAKKQIYFDTETGKYQPKIRFNERPTPTMTDPVLPPWRYGSTFTGNLTDVPSGPFPEDLGSEYDGYSPAAMTFNNPQPVAPAPVQSNGLLEGPDGYLYRMVNGVPQRTNLRRSVAAAATRESLSVPSEYQSRYQPGRVYVVNGQNYRYENGMMVR